MPNRPLRETILDAVEQCFAQYGLHKTTLADVAERAGVSRMTVYRHFKDRKALFDGASLRNLRRHWAQVAKQLRHIERLDEWLVEGMLIYQYEIAQDAAVQLYLELGAFDDGLAVSQTKIGLEAVIRQFEHLFTPLADAQGRLSNGLDAYELADFVYRANHSLLRYPSDRLADREARRRWLMAQVRGGMVPSEPAPGDMAASGRG